MWITSDIAIVSYRKYKSDRSVCLLLEIPPSHWKGLEGELPENETVALHV